MTDVTGEYESPSPTDPEELPTGNTPTESSSHDAGEAASKTELQQPRGLPRYVAMELRRRTPDEQVAYLTAKLLERQADVAGATTLLAEERRTADVLARQVRDLAQERRELLDWKAGAERTIAAGRNEISRLDDALGVARAQVDEAVANATSWQEWGEGHKRRADAVPDAVAALTVRPGDRVAVVTSGDSGDLLAHLELSCPTVEFVIIEGVVGIIRMDPS